MYGNWPPKAEGTVRPLKQADISRTAQSTIYWGLMGRNMSWAAARQKDPPHLKAGGGICVLN